MLHFLPHDHIFFSPPPPIQIIQLVRYGEAAVETFKLDASKTKETLQKMCPV